MKNQNQSLYHAVHDDEELGLLCKNAVEATSMRLKIVEEKITI